MKNRRFRLNVAISLTVIVFAVALFALTQKIQYEHKANTIKRTNIEHVHQLYSFLNQHINDALQNISEKINSNTTNELPYTDDELFCMACVIYQEAGGDYMSDETRELVGYVVLNRVNHKAFPNTIREVLLQKRQYGRLHWTGIKFPDRHLNAGEQHAVTRAYETAHKVLTTQNPLPPSVIFQAEFKQGSGVYKFIDDTYFCYE